MKAPGKTSAKTVYVALLRGINVGGNNIIPMVRLKACLEELGLSDVQTYIQSGNVVFASGEKDADKLARRIEKALADTFTYHGKIVLRSASQMKALAAGFPKTWSSPTFIAANRCYVIFLRPSIDKKSVLGAMGAKEGIDTVSYKPGVVYHSAPFAMLTRSGLSKLPMRKEYKEVTIRNLNTTLKLLAMTGGASVSRGGAKKK